MKPERVQVGATVRVRERHRIAERRGMVGRIAEHYGGDGYMAVDVRFSGGHRRLFSGGPGGDLLTPTVVAFAARWGLTRRKYPGTQ